MHTPSLSPCLSPYSYLSLSFSLSLLPRLRSLSTFPFHYFPRFLLVSPHVRCLVFTRDDHVNIYATVHVVYHMHKYRGLGLLPQQRVLHLVVMLTGTQLIIHMNT